MEKIFTDAMIDAEMGIAISAGSTIVGAVVGSFIPIPGVGTAIGAGAGYVFGRGIDALLDVKWEIFGNKTLVDLAKDGGDWFVDRVCDTGNWIADTASNAWNTAAGFVENVGDTIDSLIDDAGRAVDDFFDDVGGFFSGIFA